MTVLRHEKGHEVKVLHNHISPKMRGELESIPMHADSKSMGEPKAQRMADGGLTLNAEDIDPNFHFAPTNREEQTQAIMDAQRAYQEAKHPDTVQSLANIAEFGSGQRPNIPMPEPVAGMETKAIPVGQPMQPQAPQPQVPQDPYGTAAYEQNYLRGMGEQKAGIFGQAKAESELGRQQAGALQDNIRQGQELMNNFKHSYGEADSERKAFMQDVQNQHVDPNHFWANRSTPGKIGTIIGMIIGGLGNSDAPMKMLQTQIERDIDAQKTELGKKFNLLNVNHQKFQTLSDATNMTRVMLMDQVSNQLKLAAANTADPMAKSRALQMAGQLDTQAAPLMSQIAMRRAVLGGASQGQINPAMAVRTIVPEHQQAAAYKELGEAQDLTTAQNNALGAFDKVSKLNTIANRVTSPIQSGRQIDALIQPIIAELSKATAGRFTEADAKFLGSQWPSAGDDQNTIGTKRAALLKLLQAKMHFPVLQSYGINPSGGSRYSSQGQNMIAESAPRFK